MNRSPSVLAGTLLALLAAPLLAGWDEGVAAYRSGRYDDAVAEFRAFVERSPQAADGHFMLGLSLLGQKREAQALDALERAAALGQGELRFALALAQAQIKTGDADGALRTLGGQDPASVAAAQRETFHQLLAKAADSAAGAAPARVLLEKALAADPGSKPLWLALANVARRLDRPEQRFRALSAAFELDPADAEPGRKAVHAAIALAQDDIDDAGKLGWYREASAVARRLAAASPTAEHRMLAGSAEMGAQEYERAVASFEEVVAGGGDEPLLQLYLGRSHLALGHDEQALTHLQAALDQSPGPERTREIHAARAVALRNLEQLDRAAEAYRLAGDEAAAAEMAGYAETRREWAAARADCIAKRDKVRRLLADSDGLEDSPEWKVLEREAAEILAACAPYLEEHG